MLTFNFNLKVHWQQSTLDIFESTQPHVGFVGKEWNFFLQITLFNTSLKILDNLRITRSWTTYLYIFCDSQVLKVDYSKFLRFVD